VGGANGELRLRIVTAGPDDLRDDVLGEPSPPGFNVRHIGVTDEAIQVRLVDYQEPTVGPPEG
jgi:hypothetical protein